jgi:hypothetical protein
VAQVSQLMAPITSQDLQQAITSLNTQASSGMDGLTASWFQHMLPAISEHLLELYNFLLQAGTIPLNYGQILGILIPKQHNNITLDTTRFFSIYNVDYKLFMKILVNRLTPFLNDVLHPTQYGVPGAPPIYVILSQIRDFIQYVQRFPSHTFAIFTTDFSRAFDSVSLPYLFSTLQAMGFPTTFIRLLQALFHSRRVNLKINGRILSPFGMHRGVSQGCPLSSVLFSIALTPLLTKFHSLLPGITLNTYRLNVLSYIDDITYVISTPSEACIIYDLLNEFTVFSHIQINRRKSQLLCFSASSRASYGNVCPTVDKLKVLGIHWFPTLQQTVHFNGDVLIAAVAIMNEYQHLFSTLYHRVYFINTYIFSSLYYFLQILPFLPKQYALLNKYVGYSLWKNHFLRIHRTVLYAPSCHGGLNLKNVVLQSQALRFQRHLQIICTYNNTFAYGFLLHVLYHIQLEAPININSLSNFSSFLFDTYIELAYFQLQQLDFDDFNTRRIYTLFWERTPISPHLLSRRYPSHDWRAIFNNFQFLRKFPIIHDVWYKLVYNVLPHNTKLHRLNILATDLCVTCQIPETMEHIITACGYNIHVWRHYLTLVSRLLRTSPSFLTYEHFIQYPVFPCFPPRKKQFLLWLTGHTIFYLFQRHGYHMATSYIAYLRFNLQAFSPDQLYFYFARFYTVVFD